MEITLEAALDARPEAVLAEVSDLPGYCEWHGMVKRVEPDGDGWLVDLGARLGPFTRTKRVRFVRADGGDGEPREPGRVRFVRAERDRVDYGGWEMDAVVAPATGDGPCTLTFRLRYDGSSPLTGLLEPLLRAETDRSADRLRQRLAGT